MSPGQHDVERATAGLVMALFLASALFLAVLLYFILSDINQRAETEAESAPTVRLHEPPPLDIPAVSSLPPTALS